MKKQILNQLGEALADIASTGKLRLKGIALTQSEYNELWNIGRDIVCNGKASTINATCKNVLEKFNFNIKTQGIGWEITR